MNRLAFVRLMQRHIHQAMPLRRFVNRLYVSKHCHLQQAKKQLPQQIIIKIDYYAVAYCSSSTTGIVVAIESNIEANPCNFFA